MQIIRFPYPDPETPNERTAQRNVEYAGRLALFVGLMLGIILGAVITLAATNPCESGQVAFYSPRTASHSMCVSVEDFYTPR